MPKRQRAKPTVEADLKIRQAELFDIPQIAKLTREVYPGMPTYRDGHIRGQIQAFPAGCFVAVLKNQIVGYCASFLTTESLAFAEHTWAEITGGGYNSRHNPDGNILYGMEICVSLKHQGLSIGSRLYEARRNLCEELSLKGIVIVGRIPGYIKKEQDYSTPRAYVKAVRDRRIKDRVLNFQLSHDFVYKRVIKAYLQSDFESGGNAVLLFWKNPTEDHMAAAEKKPGMHGPKSTVRVTTVNYQQRRVKSFQEFIGIVEYFVDVASDYSSDFIVFPEWFTLQLLSFEKEIPEPVDGIRKLAKYSDRLKVALRKMALRYNINIIGGSTSYKEPKTQEIYNVASVFLRDGAVYEQSKLHPTPNEVYWWNLKGGRKLEAIPTDCGLIGVLVCYDSEFPEAVRHLVDQGMKILFVPFCTDDRTSYMRLRYCAQARAIENQIYVVLSGNVGNLPRVENMDIQYAQSCILTPCDFPFARDGVAADTTPNVEMVATADLRMDDLIRARNSGTVQNLKDRRHDLYQLVWKDS